MPINERANLVFQDSDIIPLFIQARPSHASVRFAPPCSQNNTMLPQENYLNLRPASAGTDEIRRMARVVVLAH